MLDDLPLDSEKQNTQAKKKHTETKSNHELQYLVLARKYRPKFFQDLIGQETTIQILKNAISQKRIPHAILLTGIRGVGKTTIARLIAKALNCTNQDHPTANFCGKCTQCTGISNSNNQDILEIDAASHTSVTNVKDIIENAKYTPMEGRFRIYIIDEVHMLSNSAFNALLKTLEEPPEHVKFIFATTEANKIPLTILSRCQRFHLRKVDPELLAKYYSDIVKREDFSTEANAMRIIAEAADGSVRDGLSILDQAMAISTAKENNITTKDVEKMLGLDHKNIAADLFLKLKDNKTSILELLEELHNLYLHGLEANFFLQDCIKLIHDTMKIKLLNQDLEKQTHDSESMHDALRHDQKYHEYFKIIDQKATEKYITQIISLAKYHQYDFLKKTWKTLVEAHFEVKITSSNWMAIEILAMKIFQLHRSNSRTNAAPSQNSATIPDAQNNHSTKIQITSKAEPEIKDQYIQIQKNTADKKNTSQEIDTLYQLAQNAIHNNEMLLYHWLMHEIAVLHLDQSKCEMYFTQTNDNLTKNLHTKIKEKLDHITQKKWKIEDHSKINAVQSNTVNNPITELYSQDQKAQVLKTKTQNKTLAQQLDEALAKKKEKILHDTSVHTILTKMPEAKITNIEIHKKNEVNIPINKLQNNDHNSNKKNEES